MIYIVDDDADYRFLVQQMFKRFLPQCPLRLFADGLELIQSIELHSDLSPVDGAAPDSALPDLPRPNLLVLDVDMPKLNGFQTLERLKQHPSWQAVPVVIMSSRLESNVSDAALQQGAVSYILKPMNLMEIRDVMAQLCQRWLDPQPGPPDLRVSVG